jgi:restriction endonuclease Mrr
MQLTFDGPDPASPEGQRRIQENGPATIRGMLNLFGRKLDLVAEYEDRVPAYVEQMFDRLEASGIIDGWNRGDWKVRTTRIGLDIRITPAEHILEELAARAKAEAEAKRAEAEAARAEAEAKRAEARAHSAQAKIDEAKAEAEARAKPAKEKPAPKRRRK